MKKIKIGFLPLYIKLYDECGLDIRDRLSGFYESVARAFEADGFEVIRTPIICVRQEFEQAVRGYESAGADAIVTWHAAYSPSLESADVLAGTKLPIVVLDTTDTYHFHSPEDYNLCHGIHGVMDMCNLLKRNGKKYAIAAGPFPESDVVKRAGGLVKAAVAASSVAGSRVGSVGGSFDGMGDFLISDSDLQSIFGVEAVYSSASELNEIRSALNPQEIEAEMKKDLQDYEIREPLNPDVHRKTVEDCLTIRQWIKRHQLNAFTVNFTKIGPDCGMRIMPFMEACKEMAAGVGYAGEGDVLTATMTGALIRGFGSATFVEIFCPDWKNDMLLLSHMGEYNVALAQKKPLMKEIYFQFGHADNPVVSYGYYRPGKAVLCNVFRNEEGTFSLLLAPVEMIDRRPDEFEGYVHGWMKPQIPVARFLEAISKAGVTHHSSLVYDANIWELEYFGQLLNMKVIKVQ
ncbi:MAG: hypothetical protein IJR83_07895 [Clostridia bacterium]|nr:hypothetical protein [Clostridia bacterium]